MTTLTDLVLEAITHVPTYEPADAIRLHAGSELVFVDVRDEDEVRASGRIPGSIHAPRGMLEFHLTPESPHYRPIFAGEWEFVFYCGDGERSALAARTAQRLGLRRVAALAGGLDRWRAAGGAVEDPGYLAPIRIADLVGPCGA